MEFFKSDSKVAFMGARKAWYAVSAVLFIVSLAALFTKGLNFGIDFESGAEPETRLACTERRVEGEVPRCELFETESTLRARQVLTEGDHFPSLRGVVTHDLDFRDAFGELQRSLQTVGEAS